MNAKRIIKCKSNLRIRCSALDERLNQEANSHLKGLDLMVVTNFETNERRILGVVYRTSSKDRGLMLNFCPFCGTQIDKNFHKGTSEK